MLNADDDNTFPDDRMFYVEKVAEISSLSLNAVFFTSVVVGLFQFKPDMLVNKLSVSKDGIHINISNQQLIQVSTFTGD